LHLLLLFQNGSNSVLLKITPIVSAFDCLLCIATQLVGEPQPLTFFITDQRQQHDAIFGVL